MTEENFFSSNRISICHSSQYPWVSFRSSKVEFRAFTSNDTELSQRTQNVKICSSLFYDSSLPKAGPGNNLQVRVVSSGKVSTCWCGKIVFGRPHQQGCAHSTTCSV